MVKLSIINNKNYGFLFWTIIGILIIFLKNPFEIAIWRDRAYLIYMTQTVLRGDGIYSSTSFGYTPLTQMIGAGIMQFLSVFLGQIDTVLISRILGIFTFGLCTGSIFRLGHKFFKNFTAGHYASLIFIGLGFFQLLSATNFEPKMLALLFEIWGFYYLLKNRNLYSGVFLSFAAMCWQPMVINCFAITIYVFIINKYDLKMFVRQMIPFIGGVIIGTMPVVIYIFYFNEWTEFWNQAVIRKVKVEGDTLFEAPFKWIMKVIIPRMFDEIMYFVFAFFGFISLIISRLKLKKFNGFSISNINNNHIIFLLTLVFGWSLFNSMEFQGPPDFTPMIPLMIFCAVIFLYNLSLKLGPKMHYIIMVTLSLYAVFTTLHFDKGTSYKEQKEIVKGLSQHQNNVFVINFEEYYVLRNEKMPTKYMRYADYEDKVIDLMEKDGCNTILYQLHNEIKPSLIVELSGEHNKKTGKCGMRIINELHDQKPIDEFKVHYKATRLSTNKIPETKYNIYTTKYSGLED